MDIKVDDATMKKAEGLIEEFRLDYFKERFSPIKNIYIDMEVLQDFRMGALLCLIETQSEFDYIKHVVNKKDSVYQSRLHDRTMEFFPILDHITDEDIDKFIEDKKNHKALVKVSPMTLMYQELPEILGMLEDRNNAVSRNTSPNGTIHIGTNTVHYDNKDQYNLTLAILAANINFKPYIYNKPFYAIGRSLESYDMFFINNIRKFLEEPVKPRLFDDSLPIFDSTMLGFPLLEVEYDDDDHAAELIANTEVIFNTYTKFHYIPRGVIL